VDADGTIKLLAVIPADLPKLDGLPAAVGMSCSIRHPGTVAGTTTRNAHASSGPPRAAPPAPPGRDAGEYRWTLWVQGTA
jgi:hypothetical protein